jgi:WD40 repeat protein
VAVPSVAISRDGQTLVSAGGDKTIKVWHIPTGQLTRTLTGHSWLYAVAISPDGQTLVSGNGDEGTIQVWHLPTGQLTRTLVGHSAGFIVLPSARMGRLLSVAVMTNHQNLASPDWGIDKNFASAGHSNELFRFSRHQPGWANSCQLQFRRNHQNLASSDWEIDKNFGRG